MIRPYPLPLLLGLLLAAACTDYTPKPRGYFRIDPADTATYLPFDSGGLPYRFNRAAQSVVSFPADSSLRQGILLTYPAWQATLYGTYRPITRRDLPAHTAESLRLLEQQLPPGAHVSEKAYEHAEARVYGSLFLIEGDIASPIQFLLTDSNRHLFRGALYFDCRPNADSLAPVTGYLYHDIIELIQSFRWKN